MIKVGYENQRLLYGFMGKGGLEFTFEIALKKPVDEGRLDYALNNSLLALPYFKNVPVRDAYNIFFEESDNSEEYLFSVSFADNILRLTVNHGLTDARGFVIFSKVLLLYYFDDVTDAGRIIDSIDRNFCYEEYAKPHKDVVSLISHKRAYCLNNSDETVSKYCTISCDLTSLKELAAKYNTTIGFLISGLISYSIYRTYECDRDIVSLISIDLRQVFNTNPISNFSFSLPIRMNKEILSRGLFDIIKNHREIFDGLYNRKNIEEAIYLSVRNDRFFEAERISTEKKEMMIKDIFKKQSLLYTFHLANLGIYKLPESIEEMICDFKAFCPAILTDLSIAVCTFKDRINLVWGQNFTDDSLIENFCGILGEKVMVDFIEEMHNGGNFNE